MTGAPVQVAALYQFASVSDPLAVRDRLTALCGAEVRGTLLVAHEGINGTIAGPETAIARVLAGIRGLPGFEGMDVKTALADAMPFYRMKVRVKPEIVTMGQPDLDPARNAGVYVSPEDWNALISDPDTVVIDTRNDYEGAIGAFEGAIQPNTKSFRDFPVWFEAEGRKLLERPTPPKVAMYCTGGIRCEKSTAYLKAQGVADVHHLQGGILKYLETVPEAESLWHGECFVFDERVAVGHGLAVGSHTLCRACRAPLGEVERSSELYVEGVSCPQCHGSRTETQRASYRERHRQVALAELKGIAHVGAKIGDDAGD